MYKKLLISAGGGIVSAEQQAEQNASATIAIGLGGTGISCLRSLKKEIFDRLRPDDPKATVPSYSHIKFLAIDTDKSSLADDGRVDDLDSNTEFLDLSCADISALLSSAPVLRTSPSLQWLKASATEPSGTGIEIQSAEAGAGGVRQIGRLLLIQNSTKFIDKLTTLITQARAGLPAGAETNIHIFTGMGGGTGAGTFLDTCYLVQYVLGTLGIQGSAYTCGYFFMPDVNIAKVADAKIQEYIKSNGFASMQELDYCMNMEINGGSWDQDYGNGVEIHTTNPPVKLAHLITATDAAGAIKTDAYNYAMHVAVDYVMEFLIRPKTSADSTTDNPFTIKSHIANINNLINMVNKNRGACYNYCVLGASNAYLPYKEITTYLSAKIFAGFGRLNQQLPTEPDLDVFMQTCALRYEDILKSMNHQVPPVPMYDVDKNLLHQQVAGITPDVIPQVLGQMRNATAKIQGQMTANQKALLEDAQDTAVENGKGIASMIGRVRKQLMLLAANPDKGPYYAAAVLHSVHAKDLSNRVDGFIVENQNNLNMAMNDMTLRQNSMANALRELQNSNMINRGGRAERYVQSVNAYYRQEAKIDLYQATANTLSQFKRQISELYTQFFGIFEKILRELQSTFAENLSTLSHPVAQNNDYAMKLLTIQDLQASLDDAVKAMQINDLISGFVTYMLERPDLWLAEDESKISRGVSNYFLDQLHYFTHRTMNDYLKIKFDTTDPSTIAKKVRDDILLPLAQKAEPLFWTDNALYSIAEAGKLGYCSIPEESQEIDRAAQDYHTAETTVSIRPSYSSDRISFLMFRCGIPMFAYKGTDNYRGAKTVVGAHLYEAAVGDTRDWRKLFDITPYSCRSDRLITDELRRRAEAVEEATQKGIREIQQLGANSYQFLIHLYDEEMVSNAVAKTEEILSARDVEKARRLLAGLEGQPLKEIGQTVMKNIGTSKFEDLSNKDLIIASEEMSNLVARQVELVNTYEGCKKRLSDFINDAEKKANDIQAFASALCTGVITMINDYTFVYVKSDEFGLTEEEEITNIDAQPYGELLPLYSAYMNFTQLDEETKQLISTGIRDKKVNHRDEVAAALEETKTLIVPEKMQAMAARAQRSFASESKTIMKFLKEFATEVSSFF